MVLVSFGLAAAVASANMSSLGFKFDNRDYTATAKVQMNAIGGTPGGPFEVEILDYSASLFPLHQINGLYWKADTKHWAFRTFCIEENIHMNFNTQFYVSLDAFAVRGTYAHIPGDRHAINQKSTWVYSQWLDGALPSSYKNVDVSNALWLLQGQYTAQNTDHPTAAAVNLANSAGTAWGGMALNLWSLTVRNGAVVGTPTDVQSQIVQLVPAPAAAMLGMMGLGLVGWVKRRMA